MWKKYAICLTSLCEILLGYQIYLRSICLLWTSKDFILLFWELFNPNCRQCKSCLCISVVFKQFDLCFLLNHLNLWVITDYSFSTTKDQYKWFLRVYWKHMEQILGWFCRLHHWKNLQVQFLGMNFAIEIFRSSSLFSKFGCSFKIYNDMGCYLFWRFVDCDVFIVSSIQQGTPLWKVIHIKHHFVVCTHESYIFSVQYRSALLHL